MIKEAIVRVGPQHQENKRVTIFVGKIIQISEQIFKISLRPVRCLGLISHSDFYSR